MKKILSLIFLAVFVTSYGYSQSAAIKKIATKFSSKTIKKEAFHSAAKRSEKELLKEGIERTGKKYTGQALGEQIVKKSIRNSILEKMEKEGIASFFGYSTFVSDNTIKRIGKSKLNVFNEAKRSRLSNYSNAVRNNASESVAKKELKRDAAHLNADVKGKNKVSASFENRAKRIGNTFSAEENNAIIKKYSSKLQLSPEKSQRLLSEMNADNGLATLIHENPEFNIVRWTKTRNHVDKKLIARSPKGKMPINARVYAGNVYYFNPHLNSGLQARLKRGNGFVDLRGRSDLSYEDLVKLDKLYPDGVPFTKEGFPDFSYVAAKGRDGKPIKVNIGSLTGDSKKDINMAETIFQNMGYSWEKGFTWHHIENTTSLLRVPTQIHQLVDHTGGMSMSGLK